MQLNERHPWLDINVDGTDYVEPEYYRKLLKPYSFGGLTDLDIIRKNLSDQVGDDVLELGCGEGRSGQAILDANPNPDSYTFVDASKLMVSKTGERFSNLPGVQVKQADSMTFLAETEGKFDLIASIWSISTSIHQMLRAASTVEAGKQEFDNVMRKVVNENLNPGGRFFVVHYDALCDEQRILMDQWRRTDELCPPAGAQSPSLECFESTLHGLAEEGAITYQITRVEGDPITYSSLEEALEIFMNFHMSSKFNDSPHTAAVLADLEEYFTGFTDEAGQIHIRPGCFLIDFKKNEA